VLGNSTTKIIIGKGLTLFPFHIEPAVVPEFGEGASSTAEARQAASTAQSVEEPTIVPKVPTVGPAKAKNDKAEEPQVEKIEKMPKILSPPAEAKLPKVQKASAATPKRRRMASVLDAVLETTKALSPGPIKKNTEAVKVQDKAEAGPSAPARIKAVLPEGKADQQAADTGMAARQVMAEKAKPSVSEALVEDIDYIFRHASGKKLSEEEIVEARHYAQRLKYPKGALVFNDSNEDDFLYCLPDNKEISVCREIAKSMGFPKLEEGLSVMSKDDLADSLAYNSIKVWELTLKLGMRYSICHAQFFLLLRKV
jgi:hypothetical protein